MNFMQINLMSYNKTDRSGSGDVISAAAHDPNSPHTIKENLLKWCQMKTSGYPVKNK